MREKTIRIIEPDALPLKRYMEEVFSYRSLIWLFASQEIKAQYAQTYLGILWSVMKPALTLGLFTLVFQQFLQVPTQTPYVLFAFSGLIAWNFFFQITQTASGAIASKQQLIRKMYFPRIILPLSKVIVCGIDFVVSLLLFLLISFYYNIPPSIHLSYLPVFIALNILCGLSIAFWMNSLNVRFKDLSQIVPALIGMGVWVTPVFYPSTIIPAGYEFLLYANPMAGVIKGYRYALLGEAFPEWPYWISLFTTLLTSMAGAWYLSRIEDEMVDYA